MEENKKQNELNGEELKQISGGANITHVMYCSKCGFTSSDKITNCPKCDTPLSKRIFAEDA